MVTMRTDDTQQGPSQATSATQQSARVKQSPGNGDGMDAEMSDVRPALAPESLEDAQSETATVMASTGEDPFGTSPLNQSGFT
jgi:hypothetical protein